MAHNIFEAGLKRFMQPAYILEWVSSTLMRIISIIFSAFKIFLNADPFACYFGLLFISCSLS